MLSVSRIGVLSARCSIYYSLQPEHIKDLESSGLHLCPFGYKTYTIEPRGGWYDQNLISHNRSKFITWWQYILQDCYFCFK